jgi:chlorobactene glucosyltransferase
VTRWLLLDTLVSLLMIPLVRALVVMLRGPGTIPLRAPGGDEPFVSVLVPARDEELAIGRCVGTLLAQEYPRFEVLVLDDHSTDRTGEILAELASSDQRLRVFQGEERPPGWSGKCWALHQVSRHARGDWLLFVDADTAHHPRMLASTVAFAEQRGADLLTLAPGQELVSFWERALLPAIFGVILAAAGNLDEVNDPANPAAKANGQFLLFRAETYRRLGGHESVRDEIVEDFALARRVKGTGHRLLFVEGKALVSVRMYRSFEEIWRGFSKNTFLEARRHPGGLLGGLLLPWLMVLLPPALVIWLGLRRVHGGPRSPRERVLLLQAGLQTGVMAGFSLQLIRLLGLPLRWALLLPPGLLVFSAILLDSAYRVLSGKGVTWKGRTYTSTEVA